MAERVSAASCHPASPQGGLGPLIQLREGQQLGQWVPAGVSDGLDWSASSSLRGGATGFPSRAVCPHDYDLKEPGFHGPGHTFQQVFIEHLQCVRHCYWHLGYVSE